MHSRIFIFLSLLSVSLYSLPANSGPDRTTEWLMDERASVFDLGMIRLQTRLDGFIYKWPTEFSQPTIAYVWDDNEIVIKMLSINVYESVKDAKEGCRTAFNRVRAVAGVDIEEGGLTFKKNNSFFSFYFSHLGYVSGSVKEQDQRLADLDKKFKLECTILFEGGERTQGFSRLLSKGAYFND